MPTTSQPPQWIDDTEESYKQHLGLGNSYKNLTEVASVNHFSQNSPVPRAEDLLKLFPPEGKASEASDSLSASGRQTSTAGGSRPSSSIRSRLLGNSADSDIGNSGTDADSNSAEKGTKHSAKPERRLYERMSQAQMVLHTKSKPCARETQAGDNESFFDTQFGTLLL
jgi:hypothetical protein